MIGNDLAVGASKLLFLSRIFTSRRTIACVISRSCRMNGFAFAITSFSVSASLPSSPSSGGPTPTPFANSRLKALRPASTAACSSAVGSLGRLSAGLLLLATASAGFSADASADASALTGSTGTY